MPGELRVEDFTEQDSVKNALDDLKKHFTPKNPLIVSDVLDEEGHQYVDLVQKGGGVLGVALVGYTYVLEQMGIRFMKQAGTSAGAINTALMTVIGTKQEAKSEKILKEICELEFFSFVDGHPVARWIIKNFIQTKNFGSRATSWITGIFAIMGILIALDFILLGLHKHFPFLSSFAQLTFVLTGVWLLIMATTLIYITTLVKRLKNSGFGVNTGDAFYDWVKKQLKKNGVTTVTDLRNKAGQSVPGLHLRVTHEKGLTGIGGEVTFITSELVTQSKIQFPSMCDLFRTKGDIDTLQPAGFIRASMSIPVFFESYVIGDIPCQVQEVRQAWEKLNVKEPPTTARFVDGGILSNFPVSIFYNPDVQVPRLPVFGIDLDDAKPQDQTLSPGSWSLQGYLGRMFNTIRNYYDKDFLIKNQIYEQGIGTIVVHQYNWLNFFMSDQHKKELFALGAQAACRFLKEFNWYDYKGIRVMKEEGFLDKQNQFA